MTPVTGRRPAEVSRELGVSSSTLRRWSQQFGDILTPEAGNPGPQTAGKTTHRRYSSVDVETLQRVRQLMQKGLTVDEVRTQLAADFVPAPTSEPDPNVEVPAAELVSTAGQTLVLSPGPGDEPDIGQLVADTLSSLSDSQQIILGGQQTSRQLLGVLLQDNFNLKEENVRLRERMVDTERRVFEMKRELDGNRSVERDRMRQMEAHLFDLQRRLDAIAQQRAFTQQGDREGAPVPVPIPVVMPIAAPEPDPLPPPVAVAPAEIFEQPPTDAAIAVEPEPEVGATIAPEMAPEAPAPEPEQAPAEKQGFWAWLWGK